MNIDIKSLFIGMVVGGALVIYRASVVLANDYRKRMMSEKEEA